MEESAADPYIPRTQTRGLTRLQILTPFSLLICIASLLVCSTVATPSIADISRLHPTSITPSVRTVEAYIGAVWLGELLYCTGLVTVLGRREETKRAAVKGVGLWLVSANLVLALWAIAWVTQHFLVATLLQALLLLLLLFSNISLLIYHLPPTAITHPLNTLLVHAPLRFFLLLPLHILFPVCLFIALKFSYPPTPSGPPRDSAEWHTTAGFLILLFTHLFSLLVIVLRRDVIWCIGATWAAVAIWTSKPKPAPVYITVLIFTVLHPLCLITSAVYHFFHQRSKSVVLPPDSEFDHEEGRSRHASGIPRETPEEALGGDREVERSNDIWVGS
jgi:hypothetical protein